MITSYEILAKNPHVQLCADGSPHKAIFVDESHYIKDPKSKPATRCVLISGIPAVNNAKEIYTQLQALLPMMTSAQGYFFSDQKKGAGAALQLCQRASQAGKCIRNSDDLLTRNMVEKTLRDGNAQCVLHHQKNQRMYVMR